MVRNKGKIKQIVIKRYSEILSIYQSEKASLKTYGCAEGFNDWTMDDLYKTTIYDIARTDPMPQKEKLIVESIPYWKYWGIKQKIS